MGKISLFLVLLLLDIPRQIKDLSKDSCMTETPNKVITVASFKGIQVTGVTVSGNGRIFANFPRWRTGLPLSVAEVLPGNAYKPYPDEEMNSWETGKEISSKFICVQSVVTDDDKLYILDTSNPLLTGIITQPRVFVYDLKSNRLVKTYTFSKESVKLNSYVNDLRIDNKKGKIYFTDSGEPALIILDTRSGLFTRILDNHPYTRAESDHLIINGMAWGNAVHSDGIALDTENDILYFHALTGYTLYGIKTDDLLDTARLNHVKPFMLKTPATDGMDIDDRGNLYFGDLENNKIQYLMPDRKTIITLTEGNAVRWPDSFSIYDGYLYYSNSRIHELKEDISDMEFTINKIKLPGKNR